MTSKFALILGTVIIIGLLTLNLFICGLLSYWGTGIQPVGPGQLRAGSISGPTVGGGGPGEGK